MSKRWQEVAARLPQDRHVIGVEVGVWRGGMSEELLSLCPDMTLVMVDRWADVPDDHPYKASNEPTSQATLKDMTDAMAMTARRVSLFGERAVMMRSEGNQAVALLPDGAFDFVFLDCGFAYEGVLADVTMWWRKVKSGGFLSGHDWRHPTRGEVERAVTDALPGVAIEAGKATTWFARKVGGHG
jgi:hypothetical protein